MLDVQNDDYTSLENNAFLQDIGYILSEQQRRILNLVAQNPAYIKPNGRINKSKLARELGVPWRDVDIILKDMGTIIGNEL